MRSVTTTNAGRDEALDARMPDFVRAELAGAAGGAKYDDVRAYLRDSAHARALRKRLWKIETRLLGDSTARARHAG
jgi:hypothetical protein